MSLPFSREEFLEVFKDYNEAIWPLPLAFAIVALLTIVAATRRQGASGYVVFPILAAMWLINGLGYHILFFSTVNPIAKVFGAVFALQALLFAGMIFSKKRVFDSTWSRWTLVGFLLSLYALAVYPIIGLLTGHVYPYMPIIGVAPCPTVIFTIGLMLMAKDALPKWLFIIPLLWTIVGGSAAFVLGVREDFGLAATFLIGVTFLATARNADRSRSVGSRVGITFHRPYSRY